MIKRFPEKCRKHPLHTKIHCPFCKKDKKLILKTRGEQSEPSNEEK